MTTQNWIKDNWFRTLLIAIFSAFFCLLIWAIGYMGLLMIIGAGWGGNDITLFEIFLQLKSLVLLSVISFLAIVGLIKRKKFGIISAMSIFIAVIFIMIVGQVVSFFVGTTHSVKEYFIMFLMTLLCLSPLVYVLGSKKYRNEISLMDILVSTFISLIIVTLLVLDLITI